MKATHENPIVIDREEVRDFPVRPENSQGYQDLPLLHNIVLEVPNRLEKTG